jgi:hypothetical protein
MCSTDEESELTPTAQVYPSTLRVRAVNLTGIYHILRHHQFFFDAFMVRAVNSCPAFSRG